MIVSDANERDTENLVRAISENIEVYKVSSIDRDIKMSIGYAFTNFSLGKMTELFAEADRNMYINKSIKKGMEGQTPCPVL